MEKKNKIVKTFLIFVCIPVLIFIVNGYLANNTRSWSWDNLNTVSFITNLVALLGSISTIFVNYYTGYNSKFWYILPSILIILFIIILLLVQIGSNFGF